ncbi:disulfide bond formation protein B [Candidatus Aerophobetes bacterium]|uniref:Disulfide bond formation protein B n=1 Tax=Aerophobetes bacterium TaxID=2030807 RepID=A0A2A4YI08_UNCAE|nr:MAG: disulfide bond formation protein B [Candidatus Aerophobetes bacterium]
MRTQKICLYIAWLLSTLAFIGSIYYSEIRHYYPCTLCWYQRICLYPLVIILGVAFFRQVYDVFAYAIAFPAFGLFFSLYHLAIQHIKGFTSLHLCSSLISCSAILDAGLGYITIPMLSFVTNLAIFILLFYTRERSINTKSQ